MIGRCDVIKERGAWMYPRLLWESGVLGQLLYLEAHAIGISGAGIASYFDDEGLASYSRRLCLFIMRFSHILY
jgi:uncharacterized membrane protein